jgi:hypothetical protein
MAMLPSARPVSGRYAIHVNPLTDPGGRGVLDVVCGRSPAGIAGSNPAEYMVVKVSASGRSLVQRSPTEWIRVNECDQVQ